jgi:hypothetical protein
MRTSALLFTTSTIVFGLSGSFLTATKKPEVTRPQATSREPDSIIIEDFEGCEIDTFPREWEWRGWGQVTEKPYRVYEEDGNRFLRAEDTGQNVIVYKGFRWNVKKYPFISWRWRIRAVPEGADERIEESADNAAGIYLTYGKKLGLIPRSIKFVWSSALPVGLAFRRKGIGMPWTIVAGCGTSTLNEWETFTFNALDAYRKTFGGEPGDRPLGVGLLSDANNTGTKAFADYDDIIASKNAVETECVIEVLPIKQRDRP